MNKRNSILESLSEGMLNKTSQVNDVKRTKDGETFVKYLSKTRDSGMGDDFIGFFRSCATDSASKYTKVLSGYSGMGCFKGYSEIYCGDCSIRVISNEADEIYVFVDNPYSNDNTESQIRDTNLLVFKGDFDVTIKYFVNDMVQEIDGRCSSIDKYVDLITDYLEECGYKYFGTTYGIDMSADRSVDSVVEGQYSLFSVCVGEEFYEAFTDDVLNTVVDAKAEVYVAKLYSKLKLPTLGCRLTITFDSTKSAKSTLKSLGDVKNWVNSLKVVGTSLVVEVY